MKIHRFLCAALAASITSLACAQGNWSEPEYKKLIVEPSAQLEVWSWVVGLDSIAKEFEKEFPNIKVKVDNIGGGPTEHQKLQTAIKAGSGAPDAAQIEYDFLPSFIVTDGLADLTPLGAEQVKTDFVSWTWGQVSPDGKVVYGIPEDIGPLALMYNKKPSINIRSPFPRLGTISRR
jgi:multiple sugar transport system substrate-binding protein